MPRGSSCLGPGAWGRAKPGWHRCQHLPVPHGGQTNLLAQPGALTHPQTSLGWAFSTAGLAVLSCVGVSLLSQQGRHQPRAGRGTGELFWGFCRKNLGVTFISPLGFVRVGMDCSEIPCFQRRDRKGLGRWHQDAIKVARATTSSGMFDSPEIPHHPRQEQSIRKSTEPALAPKKSFSMSCHPESWIAMARVSWAPRPLCALVPGLCRKPCGDIWLFSELHQIPESTSPGLFPPKRAGVP